jgi:hypothetical protein
MVRVNQKQYEREAKENQLTALLKLFLVKLKQKSGTGDNYLKHHVRYGLDFLVHRRGKYKWTNI